MSRTPQYDAKIKTILDSLNPGPQTCPVSGESWIMTDEEIGWYKKFNVPPSSLSPTIRRKQLWGFNAGFNIWWNKHALTGAKILSYVHPDNPIKVIPDNEWHTIDWGNENFLNPEIEQPFIPQIRKLLMQIPLPALRLLGESKNSVGAAIISAEDSFMVFGGVLNAKRAYYGYMVDNAEDLVDSFRASQCRDSFSINQSERLHNCKMAVQSFDCFECAFIFDCRNCQKCFGSSNLRNAKFVFKNQQLTEAEYEKKMAEIDLSLFSVFQSFQDDFFNLLNERAVWPENFSVGCEDCTGEYLRHCLHCHELFSCNNNTECFVGQMSQKSSEGCAFASGYTGSNHCYEVSGVPNSNLTKFSTGSSGCLNVEYCHSCFNCENCFACVGLKNKKFCILNHQYSEEEYWSLLDKIKIAMLERGEYGQFFPGDFSPTGFRFATNFFFDFTDQELKALGAPDFDPTHGSVVSDKALEETNVIKTDDIPDRFDDVDPAKYVNKPIFDQRLGRQFSVRSDEFEFYKKHRLPFPKQHFLSRIKFLSGFSNSFILGETVCTKCHNKIIVAKNNNFPKRRVYCQSCYLKYLEENN